MIVNFFKVFFITIILPALAQVIINSLELLLNKEFLREALTDEEREQRKRRILRYLAVIILVAIINKCLSPIETVYNNAKKEIIIEDITSPPEPQIDFSNCNLEDIIVNAQSQVYTWEQLSNYSLLDLKLIRNGIFAYNGRTFKEEELTSYYSQFEWYKPSNIINYSDLSKIEQKNIDLIKELEKFKRKYGAN